MTEKNPEALNLENISSTMNILFTKKKVLECFHLGKFIEVQHISTGPNHKCKLDEFSEWTLSDQGKKKKGFGLTVNSFLYDWVKTLE